MTGWFFANLGWATFAMLLVLALRRPFAAWFGAGAAYALWLVPALRLAMPPLPSFAPGLPAPETLIILVADGAAPLPAEAAPAPLLPWLVALWAAGAAVFLAWQILSYRRFLAELSLDMRSLGAHRGLPLAESAAVQGPVALGLLRRRIVVPVDFATRYSPEEQRLALDHESVHHRRGDLWWNHLGLLILALNWFNPVAWLAFRAFRTDQELACDAVVAAAASPDARLDYARALIKSASRPGLVAACPLNHADQLKRRLKMMKDHKSSRPRLLAGAAAVTLLAAASLALGSPGFAQQSEAAAAPKQGEAAPREERREERVIIHTRHAGDGEHREHAGRAGGNADEHRREERRVVIMTGPGDGHGGHGAHAAHGDRQVHSFALHRGPGDHAVAIADCRDGNRQLANVEDGSGNRHMRFVFCGPNDMEPGRQLHALERARALLADEDDLSAESRARILAELDREIARLRAQ